MFGYEKLNVYIRATEWLALCHEIINTLPKGHSELTTQLRRAALSIPLNIAEGSGKFTPGDKKRFYGIARGSTFECAAILDALRILGIVESPKFLEAKRLLNEVAAMLTTLCTKWEQKAQG